MAKFLLVYRGGTMPETEEESAEVLQAWKDWFVCLEDALVDPGNPFTQAAKKVSADGRVKEVPENELASGYSILKTGSLEEAAALAQSCPVLLGGGQIHIFETFDVM